MQLPQDVVEVIGRPDHEMRERRRRVALEVENHVDFDVHVMKNHSNKTLAERVGTETAVSGCITPSRDRFFILDLSINFRYIEAERA
jgi:hypothetical protein